jgi:hypothetical protein
VEVARPVLLGAKRSHPNLEHLNTDALWELLASQFPQGVFMYPNTF